MSMTKEEMLAKVDSYEFKNPQNRNRAAYVAVAFDATRDLVIREFAESEDVLDHNEKIAAGALRLFAASEKRKDKPSNES